MSIYEYDEEREMRLSRADEREIGMEMGLEAGREEGVASTILMMKKKGFSAEQIADILDKDSEVVKAVLQGKELIKS